MRFLAIKLAVLMAAVPHPQHHRHHRPPRERSYLLDSTAYCDHGQTASGGPTYLGEVANNFLAFGTRIRTSRRVFGRLRFRVEDRIGSGSQLDFYTPSCTAAAGYGRQTIRVWVAR